MSQIISLHRIFQKLRPITCIDKNLAKSFAVILQTSLEARNYYRVQSYVHYCGHNYQCIGKLAGKLQNLVLILKTFEGHTIKIKRILTIHFIIFLQLLTAL